MLQLKDLIELPLCSVEHLHEFGQLPKHNVANVAYDERKSGSNSLHIITFAASCHDRVFLQPCSSAVGYSISRCYYGCAVLLYGSEGFAPVAKLKTHLLNP